MQAGGGRAAHQDGKEQIKGKAAQAHVHISVVGAEEERDEDHHVEAGQRPDPLRSPAPLQPLQAAMCTYHAMPLSLCKDTEPYA